MKAIPSGSPLIVVILCLLLGGVGAGTGAQPERPDGLSVSKWKEDLAFLVSELNERHPDLLDPERRSEFRKAAMEISRSLAERSDHEIFVELLSLCALLKDDSTLLPLTRQPLPFHCLPIVGYWFEDGIAIVAARQGAEKVVGSKIRSIGGIPIETVFQRLERTISADNPALTRWIFPRDRLVHELLVAAKILAPGQPCTLELVSPSGRSESITLTPEPIEETMRWRSTLGVDQRIPVLGGPKSKNYFFEELEDSGSLYVQINQIRDSPRGRPLGWFARQLGRKLREGEVERVILDLRHGGGGSGSNLPVLLETLARSDVNRKGSLFALIGRHTAGTVLEFASLLDLNTSVTLIGEATGDGPNRVSDTFSFQLPNSGLNVVSTAIHWRTSLPGDPRPSLEPEVPAPFKITDFLEDKDPGLEACLHFRPESRTETSNSSEVVAEITGTYRLGPYATLQISNEPGEGNEPSLGLKAQGFSRGSFFSARSRLTAVAANRFLAEIPGVSLALRKEADLLITWKGTPYRLERVQDDYEPPIKKIRDGRVEEGIRELLESKTHYEKDRTRLQFLLLEFARRSSQSNHTHGMMLLQAAAELFPDSPQVFRNLSRTLRSLGKQEEALSAEEKADHLDAK